MSTHAEGNLQTPSFPLKIVLFVPFKHASMIKNRRKNSHVISYASINISIGNCDALNKFTVYSSGEFRTQTNT